MGGAQVTLEYGIIIIGMGIVTYIPRWLPLHFLTRYRLHPLFKAWLELIPAAILSALLLPILITTGDPRQLDLLQPELWVAVPTFVFAFWTRSLGGTVIAGMLMFWVVGKLL